MAYNNRQLHMEAVSYFWWVFRQKVHQDPVVGEEQWVHSD